MNDKQKHNKEGGMRLVCRLLVLLAGGILLILYVPAVISRKWAEVDKWILLRKLATIDKNPLCAILKPYYSDDSEDSYLIPAMMVISGDKSYVGGLNERLATADPYLKVFLGACIRALGEPSDKTLVIPDVKNSVSTTCSSRFVVSNAAIPPNALHVDGFMPALFTGLLTMENGYIPRSPKLTYLDDSFGLGQKGETAAFSFDSHTGRFFLFTTTRAVFYGADSPTGGTVCEVYPIRLLVSADAAMSVEVSLSAEMPDVRIVLEKRPMIQPDKASGVREALEVEVNGLPRGKGAKL